MANDTKAVDVSMDPEVAHIISATVEGQDIYGSDDVRALHDVVQGLPSRVLKDLLSIGVRFFI